MSDSPREYYLCPNCGWVHSHAYEFCGGTTMDSEHWSDGYAYFPHLLEPSPLERCTICDALFFHWRAEEATEAQADEQTKRLREQFNDWIEEQKRKGPSSDDGNEEDYYSRRSIRRFLRQLRSDRDSMRRCQKNISGFDIWHGMPMRWPAIIQQFSGETLEADEEKFLWTNLWFELNDNLGRSSLNAAVKTRERTDHEKRLLLDIKEHLWPHLRADPLLRAELCRELDEFDECIAILDGISCGTSTTAGEMQEHGARGCLYVYFSIRNVSGENHNAVREMREHAEKGDHNAFQYEFPQVCAEELRRRIARIKRAKRRSRES